jgi:hypothetical protein
MILTMIKNKIIMSSIGFSLGLSIFDFFFIINNLYLNSTLLALIVLLVAKFDSYQEHEIESSCSSFLLFFFLGMITRISLFLYFNFIF